jgi:hypothetical protein
MKTRLLITTVLLASGIYANCQDTVFYDQDKNPADRNSAVCLQVSHYDDSVPERYVVESFYINGNRKDITYYTDKSKETITSIKEWYSDGNLKMQRTYHGGALTDTLLTFWEDGTPKRKDLYKNKTFLKGTCYDNAGKKIPHFDFEILPEYPGGESNLFMDIYSNIKMPEFVKAGSLKVTVIAKFYINTEGYIKDIKIVEGKYPETNNEVIRVLSMLKRWRPGLRDGEPVTTWYTVPITFQVK